MLGLWRLKPVLRKSQAALQRLWILFPRKVECNLCGWRGRHFLDDPWHPRTVCPRCRSHVRHRLLMAALRGGGEFDAARIARGKRALHFAPEPPLRDFFGRRTASYVTADFMRAGTDMKLDISDMSPIGNDEFDLLIACDVLEHVADDKRSLREIRRVLKPGGCAILTVPQKDGLAETFEDATVTQPAERERLFGQRDHLRIYGGDFSRRLEAAGFQVKAVDETCFAPEQVTRHVLFPPVLSANPLATNHRKIFFAHKPSLDM